MAGIDAWLTRTPDFACGVNDQGLSVREFVECLAAQVNADRENALTERKSLVALELQPEYGGKAAQLRVNQAFPSLALQALCRSLASLPSLALQASRGRDLQR
jgi:hypothetical protein